MGSIFYGEGFSPLAMKKISIKHLQLFEDRSDTACRVVLKPRAHGDMWGGGNAHGGGNGRIWIAMPSPQTPDCRGGVFAVFAKIPPPICPPYARILSRPPFPVVMARMVMSAREVFVATRHAASRLGAASF